MRGRARFLLALSFVFVGCSGKGKPDYESDRERLKAFVIDAAPAGIQKLDIDFEGKVRLLGYELDPKGAVQPGRAQKLTLYWRADKPVEDDWRLFTHLLDGSGERLLNLDSVGPLREIRDQRAALPPAAWKLGKVYIDEQSFSLPRSVKTSRVQLVAGLFRKDGRMKVVAGSDDEKDRALVARLDVERRPRAPRKARVPAFRVDKLEAGTKLVIDGKLDEPAWQSAPSAELVDVGTGEPNTHFPVNAKVRLLWDDAGFYVGFDVRDPDLVGGFKKGQKDPHLWTKDTVEIMIDPDGDGDNEDYYEIQIGPQNLVFDSQFDHYNAPKTEPDGPFGHEDWSSNAKSAVTLKGTLDQRDDKDEGYVVEALIPWKSLSKAKRSPPELGDSWRMNFYAMQENAGVAWAPIQNQGNFHKASRFGRVEWAKKDWPAPAPPELRSADLAEDAGRRPPPDMLRRLQMPKLATPRIDPSARRIPRKLSQPE